MSLKKLTLLFVIILSTFYAQSSFWFKDLDFLAMENFKVSKGEEKIVIKFDYVINNPNWYGVIIKPSELSLTIADSDCGQVYIPEKLKIKRKKKASYPFVLVGDSSKFTKSGFSSFWSMISKGKIDFNIKGTLKAGLMGITKKWKLDYTYEMTWIEFMSFFK
jgi:LEA14-like dessication related protein